MTQETTHKFTPGPDTRPENPPLHPTDLGYEAGATLFDFYACHALAAHISNTETLTVSTQVARDEGLGVSSLLATSACELADTMLKEREKWLSQYR